jgi:hypothetical protein
LDLFYFYSQGIFCTTCHEQRKLDKQKRKEERQRLQNSQKPPSPSGYVDKTLPSLPPEYAVSVIISRSKKTLSCWDYPFGNNLFINQCIILQ